MKKFTLAALAVALVTGIASADPAARIAAFNKASDNGANLNIAKLGATTNVVKELIRAGFTDDAILATDNAKVILWAVQVDGEPLSSESAKKFLAYVEEGLVSMDTATAAVSAIKLADRPLFRDVYIRKIDTKVTDLVPETPIRTALRVDIGMRVGSLAEAVVLKAATIDELVALRLAPEIRVADEATLILEKATAGAKKQLRAEGKSFVTYTEVVGGVTNTVNPLSVKLAPVVEAINAPLMTGLEGALATCGITIKSQNDARTAMSAVSDTWKNAILDGIIAPAAQAPYLTALKVSLGVEGYNVLVKAYNGEK